MLNKIKLQSILFIFGVISVISCQSNVEQQYDFTRLFDDLPFSMNVLTVPVFPDKDYNILDFGAKGDGIQKNTEAFNKAIETCSMEGGGRVIVPAGIWLTGPIQLRSNVNLHLLPGSHIQFSKDFDDYPLIESNWEGVKQYRCMSPISGYKLENIAITGSGVIDGAGDSWRYVKKFKMTANQWDNLIKSGGVLNRAGNEWWPSQQAYEGSLKVPEMLKNKHLFTKEDFEKYKDFHRPVLVNIVECKNILLDGPTFQNSPAWNIHPLLCENLIVVNINVRNPWYSQNGDGIDIESCKNVLVYNCRFDVGDDAICIKSGKDAEGRARGIPTENVVIRDCVVYHGHGGFTVGSEMSGGVRNIKISNCNFIGTDIGLRFKSTRGRGGVVENIWIENIYMQDIPTDALSFNMYYGGFAPTEDRSAEEMSRNAEVFEVNDETPIFRKIYMKNIYCNGAKDAVVLQGLPEMSIKEIELNNIVMKAERGVSMYDAENINIIDAVITSPDPVIFARQSRNILLRNLHYMPKNKIVLKLEGEKTSEIIVKGNNAEDIKAKTEVAEGISKIILKTD